MNTVQNQRMLGRAISCGLAALFAMTALLQAQTKLDPLALTKWSDPLPKPGKLTGTNLTIGMYEIQQYLHKDLETAGKITTLWGYGTSQADATYPASTIEATRGVPTYVKWENHLPTTHLLSSVIDNTLHMAMPASGVPAVVHLHGGEIESESDGGPDSWFTQGYQIKGATWKKETYTYVNEQLPTTLWYHDHVLGLTRLNVYTGLAGFYLLRDPATEAALNLPSGDYEREIVIQDRMLNEDGSLRYEVEVTNPSDHPQWGPEFFGDIIVVNGKAWPFFEVEPRKYRFRLLNGSNARFYNLFFENGMTFQQIGTDGGYLRAPVTLSSLLIAPGERADIVVDFSSVAGTNFILQNSANEPFPDGAPNDDQTTGQIMQFRVAATGAADASSVPATLSDIPVLRNGQIAKTRSLTLNEVMGPGGPLAMFLDGKMWDAPISELPEIGSTEIWEILNLTADTHPMHLHLVQFQLLNRQDFDAAGYGTAYDALNPVLPTDNPVKPDLAPFLTGVPVGPDPNEDGWKDTFRMNPGQVSRVVVRFQPNTAPLNSYDDYSFDATAEPGYVWHCHIVEHEDNEMMRPYKLTRANSSFVFLADELLKINKIAASDGNLHSNKGITIGAGAPGMHTGNLTAVDDITIRTNNTINGDVLAGDDLYLFGNVTVTGTKVKEANVARIPIPQLWFSAGGANVTVPKNGSRALSPGSYNVVKVRNNATLYLTAGDYYINVLDTDLGATLSAEATNGPVKINVVNELDLAAQVKVLITGMNPATNKVTFVTLQDPKVDIGKEALLQGSFIAQNAEVHFSTNSWFQGSLVANKITLDPFVKFLHHDSAIPFAKELAPVAEQSTTDAADIVTDYALAQNYPNPFNPETTIRFALPEDGLVTLRIYSITGQMVRELVAREFTRGKHAINWNGRDDSGQAVSTGIYFYHLLVKNSAGTMAFQQTKKMTILK